MKNTILKVYNRFSIFALLLSGSITDSVLAQERITLKRATELVIQNNLQIKQAEFSEAVASKGGGRDAWYFSREQLTAAALI